MSSLFSKLKALVQSSARGPRRRKPRAQQAASAPEATKAPPTQAAQPRAAVRVAQPGEEQSGALEEERVVDLLQGKQE